MNMLANGELEEDPGGGEAIHATPDAAEDVETPAGRVLAGQGFQESENGVEGVGGGEDVVMGDGLIDEPIAELRGADGKDAARGVGDGDEDLPAIAAEGYALPGDLLEAREG